MGVPTVGTDIPGLKDAIINNETGILVAVKDVAALTLALTKLLLDENLRASMGLSACIRAREKFDALKLTKLLLKEYNSLCDEYIK